MGRKNELQMSTAERASVPANSPRSGSRAPRSSRFGAGGRRASRKSIDPGRLRRTRGTLNAEAGAPSR